MTRLGSPPSLLAVVLVLGAAGCTGDSGDDDASDEPDPQDAATALASGLTAKDLSKVTFTRDTATTAQASYDRITQEMGAAKLVVDTAGVEQTGLHRGGDAALDVGPHRGDVGVRRRGRAEARRRTAGRWPGRRR